MSDEAVETPTKEIAPESDYFHVVDQKTVDQKLEKVEELGIDLGPNSVSLVEPGDYLFDFNETQYKLTRKYGNHEKVIEILTEYGLTEDEANRERFEKVAEDEQIDLNGELPGFAMTTGTEIIFFAIKRENAVDMAKKYVQKERSDEQILSQEDAESYLKTLGEKALYHELGHLIYGQVDHTEWDKNIEKSPEIKQRVIEIQKDKYETEDQIPVAEEAYAEKLTEILSEGKFKSRVDFEQ
jgi:hypothetical protein